MVLLFTLLFVQAQCDKTTVKKTSKIKAICLGWQIEGTSKKGSGHIKEYGIRAWSQLRNHYSAFRQQNNMLITQDMILPYRSRSISRVWQCKGQIIFWRWLSHPCLGNWPNRQDPAQLAVSLMASQLPKVQ